MNKKTSQLIERELYAARFRRNLNSLNRQLNNPACALQRVVIQSRRTGESIAVLISAGTYTAEADYMRSHINQENCEPTDASR